jgi:hypothetical protein
MIESAADVLIPGIPSDCPPGRSFEFFPWSTLLCDLVIGNMMEREFEPVSGLFALLSSKMHWFALLLLNLSIVH